MIPTESITNTYRRAAFNTVQNEKLLAASLDLIEEKREAACMKTAVYQQRVARYYNRKVKIRHFKNGDLVLRLLLLRARNPQEGALGPNWEGLYVIDEYLANRDYHLVNVNGKRFPRAWNAEYL
ncbi:hypothetical protein ACOSQ2_014487 [Xanthoceras sorbifolium]